VIATNECDYLGEEADLRFKRTRLSDEALAMVARRFRSLGEPTRLKILSKIEDGERTVGQLVEEIGSSQANVSKHLKVLLDAGVLSRRIQKTSVYYSISDPVILKICDVVCDGVAKDLKSRIEAFGVQLKPERARRTRPILPSVDVNA
jgi:DNA-binding transcriptional ArsR family regulator